MLYRHSYICVCNTEVFLETETKADVVLSVCPTCNHVLDIQVCELEGIPTDLPTV